MLVDAPSIFSGNGVAAISIGIAEKEGSNVAV